MSDYQTFEADGFKVTSNTMTSEQIGESLASQKADPGAEPAPEADPNPEAEPEPTPEPPPKAEKRPRDDPKARVAEATRNAAEAKKRIDEVQRRAEAAEAELRRIRDSQPKVPEPPKPEEAKKSAAPSDRPKLDDFESIEDHAEAVARWVAKQEREAIQQEQKARQFEEFKQKRVESFTGRMHAHLESDPDFWSRQNPDVIALRPLSVMGPNEVATPLNLLAEQFLTSENPVSLIEYFSQHPEEVQRFSQMPSEAEFYRALGKVESGLGSAAMTATATIPQVSSKAAPPARPVTGGPTTGRIPPEKETFEQYYARRSKEEEKRR